MFWIMEHTTNGYQTHNHLLLKGIGIKEVVNDFLFKKKLVNKKFIRHYDYQSEQGASYYVSKYIKSQNIKYGIAYSKTQTIIVKNRMANTTGVKYGGRQKGTPNRLTKELRAILKEALHKELESIGERLEQLEPKERLEVLI